MSGSSGSRRKPQPAAELARVAKAGRKHERTRKQLEAIRVELDDAIRAASVAGATLRPLAEASGLSVEWVRRIIAAGE